MIFGDITEGVPTPLPDITIGTDVMLTRGIPEHTMGPGQTAD
jgi:hypothetical protein